LIQILQALDDAGKEEEMMDIYLKALRDEFFIPWVKGSRLADLRGYTLPVAKIAVKNILASMKDGKLAFFNLNLAVCDAPLAEEWSDRQTSQTRQKQHEIKPSSNLNTEPTFDVKKLENYILSLEPIGLINIKRVKLEGTERILLSRESLAAWSLSSPFYGYDDSRNVWLERQSLVK
jgi:hypothetical protein